MSSRVSRQGTASSSTPSATFAVTAAPSEIRVQAAGAVTPGRRRRTVMSRTGTLGSSFW